MRFGSKVPVNCKWASKKDVEGNHLRERIPLRWGRKKGVKVMIYWGKE